MPLHGDDSTSAERASLPLLLLRAPEVNLADFMACWQSNAGKGVNALHDPRGPLWQRRHRSARPGRGMKDACAQSLPHLGKLRPYAEYLWLDAPPSARASLILRHLH